MQAGLPACRNAPRTFALLAAAFGGRPPAPDACEDKTAPSAKFHAPSAHENDEICLRAPSYRRILVAHSACAACGGCTMLEPPEAADEGRLMADRRQPPP
jgi:hypothetical protein